VGLLLVSLVVNLFQVLWSLSEDHVVNVSVAEVASLRREVTADQVHSAHWSVVLADTNEFLVIERATMVNFRGLFSPHTRRTVYIWRKRE
jgi:hypothetical protein